MRTKRKRNLKYYILNLTSYLAYSFTSLPITGLALLLLLMR